MSPNRETEPARPKLRGNDAPKRGGSKKIARNEFRSAAWVPGSITRETLNGLATCTGYAGLDGATGRAIRIGTLARAGGNEDAGGRYALLAITTGCLGAAKERSVVCCALVIRGVGAKAAAVPKTNASERKIRRHLFGVERSICALRPSEPLLSILFCVSTRNRYLRGAGTLVRA
jgi:hypothetical protein